MTSHPNAEVLLRESWAFRALTPQDIGVLGSTVRVRQLPAGDVLFRQGESGDSLAMVCSGRLLVSVVGDPHDHGYEATVGPDEFIGEMACVDPALRSATVTALGDVVLIEIDRQLFDSFMVSAPDAASALLRMMATKLGERIRATNARVSLVPCSAYPRTGFDAAQGCLRRSAGSPVDLRRTGFFRNFRDADIRALVGAGRLERLEAGHVLWNQGDPPGGCVVVTEGELEVLISGPAGGPRCVAQLGPGSLAGQMALIDGTPRAATLRVGREGARVLSLDASIVDTLLCASHKTAIRFQRELVVAGIRQLRLANALLKDLFATARKKPQPVLNRRAASPGEHVSRIAQPTDVSRARPGDRGGSRGPVSLGAEDERLGPDDLASQFLRVAVREWGVDLSELARVRRAQSALAELDRQDRLRESQQRR